jgi:O-antigen ligase
VSKKKLKTQNSSNFFMLAGVVLVTLYFNSKVQDPFNSPKFWLLLLLAMWAAGHLVVSIDQLKNRATARIVSILSLLFIFFMLMATIATDNKYTAFFGENQRRNGFLTYFALTIILLTVIAKFKRIDVNNIYLTSLFTGIILGGYSVMQTFGMDFIKWNNPYNSVIATVGNPNFAAAIMAIVAVVNLGPIFTPAFNKILRIVFGFSVLLLLFAIYRSDARQGTISFAVGFGTLLGIWVFQRNRRIGFGYIIFFLTVSILAVLGMLQVGPLKEFLYKPSVSVRGFYWRAAWAMFEDNKLFGVGIDRYGSYFKEYREKQYSLNYGFDITSTNAHNTPLQLLSTGGFFTGVFYLALVVSITYIGFKGLRSTSGNQQIILGSFLAAWLAFQSQSLISIDNIGISIWGWFLGGLVVVMSNSEMEIERIKSKSSIYAQPLISGSLAIISLILVFTLFRGETNMFQTRMRYNPQSQSNAIPLKEFAEKTISTPLVEPYYKFTSATYLITTGYVNEGMKVLKELNSLDPRDLDVLRSLGEYEAQLGNDNQAIQYFTQISEIDRWNANNYLTLGRLYKKIGDFSKVIEMRDKIASFAADTEVGKNAAIELVGP